MKTEITEQERKAIKEALTNFKKFTGEVLTDRLIEQMIEKVQNGISELRKPSESETKRCEYELYVEKYFGLNPNNTAEGTVINTDFGALCNLLAMFESETGRTDEELVKDILHILNEKAFGDVFYRSIIAWVNFEEVATEIAKLLPSYRSQQNDYRHRTLLGKLENHPQILSQVKCQENDVNVGLLECVKMLQEWNKKYPPGRIYDYSLAKTIESELTEIVKAQEQAITNYEKQNKP